MLISRRGPERKRTSLVPDLREIKAPLMSGQVFYQTKLTLAPIGNERGRLTLHYIIAVQTHDPDGNPYESHPEDRARETFNLMPGRGIAAQIPRYLARSYKSQKKLAARVGATDFISNVPWLLSFF